MNNSRIKIETGNRQALIPSINDTNISNNKTIINPPETVNTRNEAKRNDETISKAPSLLESAGVRIPPHISEIKMCHVLKKVYTFYINTKIRLQFKYNSKIYLQPPFFCNNFSIYNLPF